VVHQVRVVLEHDRKDSNESLRFYFFSEVNHKSLHNLKLSVFRRFSIIYFNLKKYYFLKSVTGRRRSFLQENIGIISTIAIT
jgi:hypothetical protein